MFSKQYSKKLIIAFDYRLKTTGLVLMPDRYIKAQN